MMSACVQPRPLICTKNSLQQSEYKQCLHWRGTNGIAQLLRRHFAWRQWCIASPLGWTGTLHQCMPAPPDRDLSGPTAEALNLRSQAILQGFSSWLSKNRDENPRMRKIFNAKFPPKGCACADSRRDFWTTNWKIPVLTVTATQLGPHVGLLLFT